MHILGVAGRHLVVVGLVVVVPEGGDELLQFGQRDVNGHGLSQPGCGPGNRPDARSVEHGLESGGYQACCSTLKRSRNRRLSSLPLGFFGNASTKKTRLGVLNPARCSRQWATTSSSVSVIPSRGTIAATTASTQTGCGRPNTATSSMPLCR